MPGLTNTTSKSALDLLFPTTGGTSHIAYSVNGTSETANLGRTAIGATGWAAATVADPSVKANANALTSPAATGAAVVSHFAIYDASTAGTQMTEWQALAATRTLATGDQLTHAVGAIAITLT